MDTQQIPPLPRCPGPSPGCSKSGDLIPGSRRSGQPQRADGDQAEGRNRKRRLDPGFQMRERGGHQGRASPRDWQRLWAGRAGRGRSRAVRVKNSGGGRALPSSPPSSPPPLSPPPLLLPLRLQPLRGAAHLSRPAAAAPRAGRDPSRAQGGEGSKVSCPTEAPVPRPAPVLRKGLLSPPQGTGLPASCCLARNAVHPAGPAWTRGLTALSRGEFILPRAHFTECWH